jgi:hypothetical protein
MDLPNVRTTRKFSVMGRNYNRYSRNKWSSNKALSRFFFKPKLSIEYDNLPDINIEQNTLPYGNLRRILKIIVKNCGKSIAENCEASLTFVKSDNSRPPSRDLKKLMWDNYQEYRTIGAKNGEATLYVMYSDSNFINEQYDLGADKPLEENKKTYAQISTVRSFSETNPNQNKFVQDGLGIGNTDFKLIVRSIDGAYAEQNIRIKVSQDWQDLSMKLLK